MSAEEYCAACIDVLLGVPDGMKTKALVEKTKVPPAIQTTVILQILDSNLISSSQTLSVKHIWYEKLDKLKIDAFDEITVRDWISANIHDEPIQFESFIRSKCETTGLHFRTSTTVRVATAFNAYDRDSLLFAITKAGLDGISRENALSEYGNAYLDLLTLQSEGEIFASDESVWYVGNLQ